MKHRRKPRRAPAGASPGTLVIDPAAPQPVIEVTAYGPGDYMERKAVGADDAFREVGKQPVVWINVDGLGDEKILRRLGELFNLHPLAIEDVVHTHQRAKVEEFDTHQFIVARMVVSGVQTEQLSIFLGKNFLLTFQEKPGGDPFGPVRERLRQGRGRSRRSGPDYLAYALFDALIDGYFPALEAIGEELDAIEEQVLNLPSRATIARIHELKRQLIVLRRAIWPLREAANALIRDETGFIQPETRPFLRDCYDHCVQLIDLAENHRDLASELSDLYLSSAGHRMNEVMKVLTIITTLFMPLSFIAGVYGMNFNTGKSPWNMPELDWYWGYPFAWGLMVIMTLAMGVFFKRKGWLERQK
jgi:magnesium transporter